MKFKVIIPEGKRAEIEADLEIAKQDFDKMNNSRKFKPMLWTLGKALGTGVAFPHMAMLDYHFNSDTEIFVEISMAGEAFMNQSMVINKINSLAEHYGGTAKKIEKETDG